MAMLKRKTRKAIRKTWKKAINKHGPVAAELLATALAAATATYLGTGGKKSRKRLKKVAKSIPGGQRILEAVSSNIPALKDHGHESNGHGHGNAHTTPKRAKRSKKHATT
jgi:hypothetical protein